MLQPKCYIAKCVDATQRDRPKKQPPYSVHSPMILNIDDIVICRVALNHHIYTVRPLAGTVVLTKANQRQWKVGHLHIFWKPLGVWLSAQPGKITLPAVVDKGSQSCLIEIADGQKMTSSLSFWACAPLTTTCYHAETPVKLKKHKRNHTSHRTLASFSREACTKLAMISTTFPSIGESQTPAEGRSTTVTTNPA